MGESRAESPGTVKRTGFSAPGNKPEKFAEWGAGLALSGSHRTQKGHDARICRYLQKIGEYARLYGG